MTDTESKPNSDEWYTKDEAVLAAARRVLGTIDLDPASCEVAQNVIRAQAYYTKADNGLAQAWYGNVFLNPPYSKPLPWVKKLLAHYEAGDIDQAILLVNTANSPQWARLLWQSPYIVCLLAKREKFWNPELPDKESTKQDQMVWYIGKQQKLFALQFKPLGGIMVAYQINAKITGTICEICDRPFNARRAGVLYCSGACRQKAKREKAKQE